MSSAERTSPNSADSTTNASSEIRNAAKFSGRSRPVKTYQGRKKHQQRRWAVIEIVVPLEQRYIEEPGVPILRSVPRIRQRKKLGERFNRQAQFSARKRASQQLVVAVNGLGAIDTLHRRRAVVTSELVLPNQPLGQRSDADPVVQRSHCHDRSQPNESILHSSYATGRAEDQLLRWNRPTSTPFPRMCPSIAASTSAREASGPRSSFVSRANSSKV